MPYTILVTILFLQLGKDGLVTRLDGGIFLAGLILYIAYLLMQAKQNPQEKTPEPLPAEAKARTSAETVAENTEKQMKP